MANTQEEINLPHFEKDNKVWIETGKHSEAMWQKATVVEQTGVFVLCMTESGRAINLDLRDDSVFPVNPSSQPDMTGLYFINEPGILFNLEERSLNDCPYTFMGNVLVAVNPLKRIADPSLPSPSLLDAPHPFTVAQNAFAQLRFAFDNSQEEVNQSVVTSGESGAGKTECCKMVLKFLVESSLQKKGGGVSQIDEKLLDSNHITESFGNAQTLRNHNSSRFGKFMKLHFERKPQEKEFQIMGATIETYLLERSRVSFHNKGERNYHIFYQLLEGVSLLKDGKQIANSFDRALNTNLKFRLLTCHEGDKIASRGKQDKESFQKVLEAMEKLNFAEDKKKEIFEILSGILHLGNFVFAEKLLNNTETAVLEEDIYKNYDVVSFASEFLGVDKEVLLSLVTKEELIIRKQKVVKIFDAFKANFTRDALCKALYSHLFNFVISQIDDAMTLEKSANEEERPFIGILDIFGFESFKRNDFEQLLINFANEALQATFNRSVFENEAELYKRERLLLDSSDLIKAPSNSACMDLFIGINSKSKPKTPQEAAKRRGLLLAIDDESQNLEPSDKKMLANLNRMFGKHQDWKRPHPKLRQEIFIIRHFAGEVKYSIGYFLEKNRDELPKSVIAVFSQSKKSILKQQFSKQKGKDSKSKTIIKKFKTQISDLVSTLESTKCSFIRCVKPNEEMKRGKAPTWFNRRYISHQLRNLSIPQTAEVLQNGFPTRLTYKSLMESYLKLIPDKALKGWKNLIAKKKQTQSSSNFPEASFVKSLLFAFEVDSKSFKLGLTMVFFKSGELAKLDKILKSAANFESYKDKEMVIKRFVYYFVRLRWREVYAKLLAFNRFKALLELVRERERIRLEKERLEKERLEKERLERERMEKEEQDKLEQLEKQRVEEEARIMQQLEEERIRREKHIKQAEETEEEKKIADLFDEVEHQAEEKVKEQFKGRGLSLTSNELDEATKTAMVELEQSVAKMEAQTRMEENIRNFYADLVNNSQQFWSQAAENIKQSLKGWGDFFRRIAETETYQKAQQRHQERMKLLKRTVKVTNRLLLRVARKSDWFKQAEERLNKIQDRIAREFEKERLREEGLEVEDETKVNRGLLENPPPIERMRRRRKQTAKSALTHRSSIKSFSRVGAGAKIRGYLTIDRKEAQTGKVSAMEHIEKVKEMIDKGVIPPSALGDLATVMERSAKSKTSLVEGQHQPKNSATSTDLSSAFGNDFPEVNPSNDKANKWCPVPLAYEGGFFYVCVTPTVTRTKKLSLLCGWEHADEKKKKRLFSHWDCDLSIIALGMIYDTLTSSKDATVRQIVKSGGKVPMFPGWKQDVYQKAVSKRKASKAGKFFFGPANRQSRRDRMHFLSACIDESFILNDPSVLGEWLAQVFAQFNAVDKPSGNAQLLEHHLVLEMFDVDTYGGVANL